MVKYYVTVHAEAVVTLEETYLVDASDVDQAELIVAEGQGEWCGDEIIEYGKTLNETIIKVKSA